MISPNGSQPLCASKVAFVLPQSGRAGPGPKGVVPAAFVSVAAVPVISQDTETQNLISSVWLVGEISRAALSRSFNWLIHLQSK